MKARAISDVKPKRISICPGAMMPLIEGEKARPVKIYPLIRGRWKKFAALPTKYPAKRMSPRVNRGWKMVCDIDKSR